VRIYSFDNSDSIESSIVLYLGSAAPFIPYFWRALVNARRKEEQREEGVTMAASATGGGQSRELCRKLSLERRVASRRRRPRTLPLGRLQPPPPAEERSCATYTYIVKPRLIVARFHSPADTHPNFTAKEMRGVINLKALQYVRMICMQCWTYRMSCAVLKPGRIQA
jgi:hypothetical protein